MKKKTFIFDTISSTNGFSFLNSKNHYLRFQPLSSHFVLAMTMALTGAGYPSTVRVESSRSRKSSRDSV